MHRRLFLIITALAFSMLVFWLAPADLNTRKGLAIFVFIGTLWITEALHLSATALLVPILAVVTGLANTKSAFSHFANPIIFLFLGGFVLAAALQKHGIDKALAHKMLSLSKGKPLFAILGLFIVTALLSMWISNTATTAMMLPLALGLLAQNESESNQTLFLFVLLGVAYSANIGGITSLVGSPPNAIAASAAGLSFRDWLQWGIPLFVVLFPIMISLLYWLFKPKLPPRLQIQSHAFRFSRQHAAVISVFIFTAAAWIFSAPIGKFVNVTKSFDSIIAVCAIVALLATNSVEWKDIQRSANWGILILFGGGIALSSVRTGSGARDWLAQRIMAFLPTLNEWVVLLVISLFVVFLTELVSNTATAALLVPLFLSMSQSLNLSDTAIAVLVAVCASCAFMLPVATPPNAIVFGSGKIPQRQMMRAGLRLNLVCALVISALAYFFLH
jgi:sodium-dependent dicarboxylate transporter 2/3/5